VTDGTTGTDPSNREEVIDRDGHSCILCESGPDTREDRSLRVRETRVEDRVTVGVTLCEDCDRLVDRSWFEDIGSVEEVVEELETLFDLYDFPGTTETYADLSKAGSYLIPGLRGRGSDSFEVYTRARRELYFKLELGRDLSRAVRRVATNRMPDQLGADFEEHVTLWEEWIDQTAEILALYDDLYDIETGESAGEATAAGPSKEALLRRKREWGEMNTEFVDVVPEFGALESPHWDRCPACGARDGVWFTSDRAECAACDTLWEKKGLLRKRWVITHGDAEGQKDTLAGWRDRAQSRFG